MGLAVESFSSTEMLDSTVVRRRAQRGRHRSLVALATVRTGTVAAVVVLRRLRLAAAEAAKAMQGRGGVAKPAPWGSFGCVPSVMLLGRGL